eukprot:SAG31_NODE_2009_length_6673_cov_3.370094_6_plen_47_part_00
MAGTVIICYQLTKVSISLIGGASPHGRNAILNGTNAVRLLQLKTVH